MVNAIPDNVRKIWDAWNIRGLILISLGFQIFLILFSPLRKRINSTILTFFLWSAYLLADYSANLCIGLIFANPNDIPNTSVKDYNYIVVFWAPFLLLHLGGPDTITAFSLEDNELWLRHLLSLVFQLVTTVYVFLLTIPGNTLWLPTVLVFFSGIIKYTERTRCLYSASMDTFRKSVMDLNRPSDARCGNQVPDTTLKVSEHDDQQTEDDHVELVRKGCEFFKKFKGLVVGKTYSFVERNESRQYFLNRTPEDALTIIEVELNLIYDYFFTKASVLRTKLGYVCRFASSTTILAALLIFFFDEKHGFRKFDVRVTYILLLGAVGLEFVAFFMLFISDWKAIRGNVLIKHLLKLKKPKWSNCKKEPYTKFKALSTNPLFRRWSGTISGFDLATYWFGEKDGSKLPRSYAVIDYFGAKKLLGKWRLKTKNPFFKELWEFIFAEIKMKSRVAEDPVMVRILCKSKGEWSIKESELEGKKRGKLMRYVNSNEVAFDETLLLWHHATAEAYRLDGSSGQKVDHAYFSKVLSDYMIYLLAMEPAIMSAVAGIGQQRIMEIISSIDKMGNVRTLEDADKLDPHIEQLMTAEGDELADELMALPENKRWEIIAKVWVELLSYAAVNCRPVALLQQLSKGGQLISFIWLSMLHLRLGIRQFKNQTSKGE